MKVVLFCGGLGTRLQEYSGTIPKPMVEIGYRPLMWHLMRYYAYYGHNDFILCLGYKGDVIKRYFLDYEECLSNDFVLSKGGKQVLLYNNDIEDWTITFVDTGLNSNIGQRLMAVREHLAGEDVFMANYADGLTDLDLSCYLDCYYQHDKIANFVCVKPSQSFHIVKMRENGWVDSLQPVQDSDVWINGGFFILKQAIFDYIQTGEDLVCEPFQRLITNHEIFAYKHQGFWACMDTFKEKKMFDEMDARGQRPWAIWENDAMEIKKNMISQNQNATTSLSKK